MNIKTLMVIPFMWFGQQSYIQESLNHQNSNHSNVNTWQTQTELTYNLELISSVITDSEKRKARVVFALTPKNKVDFPPIISTLFEYRINGEGEFNSIDILKQTTPQVHLTTYGSDIIRKNKKIYKQIKDKFDIQQANKDLMLLVFELSNLSDQAITSLEIKYGLWEKQNMDIRKKAVYTCQFD